MSSSDLRLHLLIPDLLEAVRAGTEHHGRIESVLARGTRFDLSSRGYEATVCGLFGLEADARDLPLGALVRYALTGEADGRFCMAADPVHLRADLRQVFLLDARVLNISPVEAAALVETFNLHFASHNWRLEATAPARWHLTLPAAEDVRTQPLREVMGRDIGPLLPTGPRASFWRGILNEVQMLYYGAEINRAREAEGKPAINGLWLSGTGTLPSKVAAPYARVWSDDLLATGLARRAGIEVQSMPKNLNVLLAGAPHGDHLVTLDVLQAPARDEDADNREPAPQAVDRDWLKPLQNALRQRRIAQCQIYDCAGRRWTLKRRARWWWPRGLPVTTGL